MCLVCPILKNRYFKEQPRMIASKYSIVMPKTILRNLNYVQCLNLAPMEKEWFLTSMEYSHNGKGTVAAMEHTPMIYSPVKKAWFYKKIFFEVVMAMVKDKRKYNKKIQCP